MRRLTYFLRTRQYRRTFILYLAIVLAFSSAVLFLQYQGIRTTARELFDEEAADAFAQTEQQVADTVTAIDQFLTQLYASPGRLEDFFLFFGSSASDYVQAKLDSDLYLDETYLSSCNNLVLSSRYSIRHMIYYSNLNLVDMEYNDVGYSRQQIISPETAQRICSSGCVYDKDIHKGSAYIGKISYVLDLTQVAASSFTGDEGKGLCLITQGQTLPLGDVALSQQQLQQLQDADGGVLYVDGQPLYYSLHISEQLPYSILYAAGSELYSGRMLRQFILLALVLLLAFGAITLVLIHRFSKDAAYITAILSSMERAERSQFTPVETGGRSDEFGAIAHGLNRLYDHLDSLIQKEYKLTISQQKAQMDMLSAQLSPHFLYNTLERIRMRAVLDGAGDVAEATAALGRLYRNIVKTEPAITVAQELEITRQYLELMTFLYGEEFIYHFDVEPEIGTLLTPKIWMQPIVENFFKHNFQHDGCLKVIVLQAKRGRAGIEFRFFDNMGRLEREKMEELNRQISRESSDGAGIGLRNVAHRLKLYYGDRVEMSVENNSPVGVCIRIFLKEEGPENVPTADRG